MAYAQDVKEKARRLWLLGHTFEEITKVEGMPKRPATIHKWSTEGNWKEDAEIIVRKVKEKSNEEIAEELVQFNQNTKALLRAIYTRIAELIAQSPSKPSDLRLLTLALDTIVKNMRVIMGVPSNIEKVVSESSVDITMIDKKEIIQRIKEKLKSG